MVLNYSLSNEDQLIFFKNNFKNRSLLSKPYVLVVLGVIVCNLLFFRDPNEMTNIHFYIILVIFILIIAGFIFLNRRSSLNQFKKTIRLNPSLIGERQLELVNDKIILSSDNSIFEFKINALKKVEEVKDYYYIYTDSQMAIVLPKKTKESDQFIKELNESMKTNFY